MGKYRDKYIQTKERRDMFNWMHNNNQALPGYDPSSISVQLNEQRNQMIQSIYDRELEQLGPLMLNEMQDEVYQKVMKEAGKNIKIDSSQLSKSIADGINSAMKSLGK